MKRVLLLRHGETDWNRADRIQGWEDIPLNDRGRRQAHAAAQFLAAEHSDIGRLISSDLLRATETAEVVTSFPVFEDLEIECSRAWRERDFGVHQGQAGNKFFDENPDFAILDGHDSAKENIPEEGESYIAFRERVRAAWDQPWADDSQLVLVVTHSGVIREIIALIEAVSIEEVFDDYGIATGSITEIALGEDPRLVEVNHVPPISSP